MKRTLAITGLLVGALLATGVYGVRVWRLGNIETVTRTAKGFKTRGIRQIYPYSIVPGGTYDAEEVSESVRNDVVVRQHYADIRIEKLHPVRLVNPMLAYVSYRKGNTVQWTEHPVHIKANEVVLTDGTHLVRTRCGNRIQIEKPKPLSAGIEKPEPPPPDIVFETPELGLVHPPVNYPPLVLPPPTDGDIPQAKGLISQAKVPVTLPPYWTTSPILCCGGNTPSTPYTPPPVSKVPEPQGLTVLSLIAFAITRKFLKKS
jgi:hypothetical protein